MALITAPLALLTLILRNSDPFYRAVVVMMFLNKVAISYLSGKVRSYWLNPNFAKNTEQFNKRSLNKVRGESEKEVGKSSKEERIDFSLRYSGAD